MTFAPGTKTTAVLRAFLCFSVVLLAATNIHAQSERQVRPNGPGTGIPDDDLVPWKFVEKGAAIEKASLTLYWIPASQKEMEHSALLGSRALIQDGLRCVGFRIVDSGDVATIKLLDATGKVPTAVLVNKQGAVVRRLENVHGALPPIAVERMVHDELAARDESMYRAMSDARKHTTAGEKDAAIALYKSVWEDRCFFPMAGLEAQRALKTLGVEVHDVASTLAVDPQLKPPSLNAKPGTPERKH
ncbi:MAG TPA: hypothetical protein VHX14_00070 [Thermoanaerobaculia bacterium]|jgi:hypothetical protein|nr:hypothetical protein [Thermoanaerobaculia bacterium]